MSKPHEPPRVAELDALRGVAILTVFLWHALWVYDTGLLLKAVKAFMPLFRLGVDLFFVLSGYLITGILLRTRESPGYFRRFYIRRVLRIMPAYYLVLALVLLVLPKLDPRLAEAHIGDYAWWYVFHVQNWLFALGQPEFIHTWGGTNHFWSLAVEEQYYLIWPLIVLWVAPRHLRTVCALLFLLCQASKLVLVLLGANLEMLNMSTLTCIDGLAIGSAIATLPREQARTIARPALAIGLIAGLLMAGVQASRPLYDAAATVIVTSLASLLFGAVVLQVHAGTTAGMGLALRSRTLTWFGRYSYGIYLLHFPAVYLVRGWFADHPEVLQMASMNGKSVVLMLITLAVTLVVAVPMFHLIEKPLLDLRFKLAPDPTEPKLETARPAEAAVPAGAAER